MAAWDNVVLPTGPRPNSYAAPLMDFSGIGDLYGTYAKGQMQANQLAQQNAFTKGLPKDASGNYDYPAIAEEYAKRGGLAGGLQGIGLMQNQQLIDAYRRQQAPDEEGAQAAPQAREQPSYSYPETRIPVRQATEGAISIVGPDGKDMTPEVDAAGRAAVAARQPMQVAQNTPPQPSMLPPGVSEEKLRALEKRAEFFANRANIASRLPGAGPGAGAGDRELSTQAATAAARMREQLDKYSPAAMGLSQRQEQQKKDVDTYAKRYDEIDKLGRAAPTAIKRIETGLAATNNPNFYSGKFEPFVRSFKQIHSVIGSNPNEAMSNEVFEKNANNMLESQIKSMGGSGVGQVRVAEVNIMRKGVASLGITPASNRLILEENRRLAQDNLNIAKMAQSYKESHGGLDVGFDRMVSDYYDKHPLFTQDEINDPRLLAAPTFASPGAAKASGYPSGWPVKTPNGRIVPAP